MGVCCQWDVVEFFRGNHNCPRAIKKVTLEFVELDQNENAKAFLLISLF